MSDDENRLTWDHLWAVEVERDSLRRVVQAVRDECSSFGAHTFTVDGRLVVEVSAILAALAAAADAPQPEHPEQPHEFTPTPRLVSDRCYCGESRYSPLHRSAQPADPPTKPADLMDRLRASVDAARAEREAATTDAPPPEPPEFQECDDRFDGFDGQARYCARRYGHRGPHSMDREPGPLSMTWRTPSPAQPADPPTVLTHEWRSTEDVTECNRCGAEYDVGRWVNCPGPSPTVRPHPSEATE